ncbi:MAG: hypothetical protein QW265_00175 [Candidatus Bathyarchaeia archaeon]
MEILDAAIALLIGYFAFRGFRVIKERIFLYLHFSFTLLGVGLLAHGLTTRTLVLNPGRWAISLSNFAYMIYFFMELIAYSLLIFAYLQQTKALASSVGLAALPVLIEYNPVSEIVIFCLTVFITAQCAVNYSVRRNSNSLLVLIGFALIASSHAVFPLIRLSGALFLMAHALQSIGFISLLAMLLRVTRGR